MAQKAEIQAVEKVEITTPSVDNLQLSKKTLPGKTVDDALPFVLGLHDGETSWTKEEERRVLWKIDLVVLPLLFFGGVIGYAETQAFGFAGLFGMVKDLNLFSIDFVDGQQVLDMSKYQWTSSIIALGAVAGQYPLLMLSQHMSAGLYFGLMIVYNGFITTLTLACKGFAGVMATRFLCGFSTIIQPLALIITSMWWKTSEQPLRLGIILSGTSIGSLVGQGIDLGAVNIGGVYAASPWRWIYVILGAVTMGLGLVVAAVLPATPMKAWFLTRREKEVAVQRIMANHTGIHTRQFKWQQGLEAFRDPQLYLLCTFSFTFCFVNNAFFSFGGFLVSSFGYTELQSLKLFMPASACIVVFVVTAGLLGSRFPNKRILIAIVYILPTLAGSLILWKSDRDNKAALLAGLYVSCSFYGALIQQYSLISSNIAGHSKKVVVNGTVFIVANLGTFSGPWAYKSSQQSVGYTDGQISTMCLMVASLTSFSLLWWYYSRCNRRKAGPQPESGDRQEHEQYAPDPTTAFMDMTDIENPVFRYAT